LTADSAATSAQKVEAIQQLTSQNETLTLTFKVSTERYCVLVVKVVITAIMTITIL